MSKLKPAILALFIIAFIPISNAVERGIGLASPDYIRLGWPWLCCIIFGALLFFISARYPLKFKINAVCLICAVIIAAVLFLPFFIRYVRFVISSDIAAYFICTASGFLLCMGLFSTKD